MKRLGQRNLVELQFPVDELLDVLRRHGYLDGLAVGDLLKEKVPVAPDSLSALRVGIEPDMETITVVAEVEGGDARLRPREAVYLDLGER